MRLPRTTASAWLLAVALLAGCTTDQYARMLIEQDTTLGKTDQEVRGKTEQQIKTGRIDDARQYRLPDGIEIDLWIIKAKAGARGTVLVLHDLCESKVVYRPLGTQLAAKGFDVVLADLRAHGRSSGKYVTFGALEKRDQKEVMDRLYGEKLVSAPLYVFGVGLGAAVAIDYAAIDPRVQGVMALAPYRDMPSFCRTLLNRVAPFMDEEDFRKVVARAGEMGDFDPAEASTVAAAGHVHCPLLLVHGRLDMVIPCTDSEQILTAAKGPKELTILPLGGQIGRMVFLGEPEVIKGIEKIASGQVGTATRPAS